MELLQARYLPSVREIAPRVRSLSQIETSYLIRLIERNGRATQEALRARAVYLVIETGTPQGEAAAAAAAAVRW